MTSKKMIDIKKLGTNNVDQFDASFIKLHYMNS